MSFPIPPWAVMCHLSLDFFFMAKLATLASLRGKAAVSRVRMMEYIFLWVGMNPEEFFSGRKASLLSPREWVRALLCSVARLIQLAIVRQINLQNPLLSGWTGGVGFILFLHFGLFHILALVWRRRGLPVRPLMDRPFCSASLAEFWGKRWNGAYHHICRILLFDPLARKFGAGVSMLFTFGASGLIHDAVISLPAGGGYGMPTAYFLIQGVGIFLERTMGFFRGTIYGWIYAMIFVLGPAPLLFHWAFIENVLLPMMSALRLIP